MDENYILTKMEASQLQSLTDAISSASSRGWTIGATGVTSYNLAGISASEFLVIQKIQLPNGTYASTTFIIPKTALLTAGTIIDGFYYNANYYGTFGIKVSANKIENDPSWIRMQYGSGTVITTAVLDVYYR